MIGTSSLPAQFFNEKIESHREPSRKGVKKGEKIGYPVAKLKSALLTVFGKTQKEVSDTLKISFPLVRKWHSEKDFQNLTKNLSNELEIRFLSKFEDLTRLFSEDLPFPSVFREFGHSDDYGPALTERIIKIILKRVEDDPSSISLLLIALSLLENNFCSSSKELNEMVDVYISAIRVRLLMLLDRCKEQEETIAVALNYDKILHTFVEAERLSLAKKARQHGLQEKIGMFDLHTGTIRIMEDKRNTRSKGKSPKGK